MSDLSILFDKHHEILDEAIVAVHTRRFYAHWPESPSGKNYGESARADGEAMFNAYLNNRFEALELDGAERWYGTEESPYGFPLNIAYPVIPVETMVNRAVDAFAEWQNIRPSERAGVLIEALEQASKNFFALAFATMHTTGQGHMMAFQASGPHAFDRALEATALGYHELTRFPESVDWEKPMGKFSIKLRKRYRMTGKGVAAAVGCSTFPVWNSLPGIFASLVTGNPVIVKPHPGAVLPLAIVTADLRRCLKDNGLNPDLVQLAVDTEMPITKALVEHPKVKIIDYTGGSAFGNYIESLAGKIAFTEKAGVNSVVIDSVEDLDAALDNLAFSACLYSGQMCTTPQNFFIPSSGVRVGDNIVPYKEVVRRFVQKIDAIAGNEKVGPSTVGAIQSRATIDRLEEAQSLGFNVLRKPEPVIQPGFKSARSFSPTVIEVPVERKDVYEREMFGPIVFVIPTGSTEESANIASEISAGCGAIICSAYTTESAVRQYIEEKMTLAGTPPAFNLTGFIWVNQSAGFSDFHVSGGNPSGNASLVDPEFIVRRFIVVGTRESV